MKPFNTLQLFVVALATAVGVAGCVRNPVTGQRQLVLISESQEIAIGQENHPAVLAEFGRVENETIQQYLNTAGQALAAVSHRPGLEWTFTVVDSPVVNAFAMPGGFIYFTRGILAHMNSEAEMAGVLGHEIGHVTARHSVGQMTRAQLAQLGLAVGGAVSPGFGQFGGALETALGLLFLRYSRDAEREADLLGVEYAARGGYDPFQMSRFFEVLQRLSQAGDRPTLPGWLSTHPDPGERVEATRQASRERIEEFGLEVNALTVNREKHLRNLEGLVYGDNPREGFAEDGRFYHPELEFQMRVPQDWEVHNTRSAVYFVEGQQQAQIELRLADATEGTTAAEYVRQLENEGISPQSGEYRTINGNPAFVGVYAASDSDGSQPVLVAFIEFRDLLYQIVGAAGDLPAYEDLMERSILSFDRLTDEAKLNVQPDRLTIYTAREGDTPQSLAARTANPRFDFEALALLNQIGDFAPIPPGTLVKLVEPGY